MRAVMKKVIFISLVVLAAVSCQKELKEVVYSNLTDENAFTTAENAQAAVNSIYSSLHLTYREPMFYINDLTTDAGFKNASPFEVLNDVAIYNDNRTLVAWNGFFEMVARATDARQLFWERFFQGADAWRGLFPEGFRLL